MSGIIAPVESFALTSPEPRQPDLLQIALQNSAGIDVIERLSALRIQELERQAEQQFNLAMNAAQSEMGRVAPNETNKQTNSKWATYAKLDRVLRPIYVKHGFSLSFDSGQPLTPETVVAYCYVSHCAGHTRKYQSPPIPADGKGAKGGDVMTKTHATGAAMSYGMRYLLKFIFNVAIGEEDTDGNVVQGLKMDEDYVKERVKDIHLATSMQDLWDRYKGAIKEAMEQEDVVAQNIYLQAKNERKAALAKGGN